MQIQAPHSSFPPSTDLLRKISHAETLIANCLLEYTPERLILSFNGGKDCTVLLHLIDRVLTRFPQYKGSKIKVVYVAERYPFPELEQFIQETSERYQFIQLFRYEMKLKAAFETFINENEIQNFAALIGVRKTDPYCENLKEVTATDNGWPAFLRIHPILNWDYADIWDYIDMNGVDYCNLYKFGYTSLGSVLNTHPNPKLKLSDGSYAHARYLKDSTFERCGRP